VKVPPPSPEQIAEEAAKKSSAQKQGSAGHHK